MILKLKRPYPHTLESAFDCPKFIWGMILTDSFTAATIFSKEIMRSYVTFSLFLAASQMLIRQKLMILTCMILLMWHSPWRQLHLH